MRRRRGKWDRDEIMFFFLGPSISAPIVLPPSATRHRRCHTKSKTAEIQKHCHVGYSSAMLDTRVKQQWDMTLLG